MTADNRTVSTDALETLGMIISEHENRDAIHLAVEPIKATVKVFPGQDVNSKGAPEEPFVGIVDPFLKNPVHPDQWFWLVIYPRQIHSLRHVWTHPEFKDEISENTNDIEEAKKWVEDYASQYDNSYEDFMSVADDHVKKNRNGEYPDEYITGEDEMDGEYTSVEFWNNYEIIRGLKLTEEEKKVNFFTCAC